MIAYSPDRLTSKEIIAGRGYVFVDPRTPNVRGVHLSEEFEDYIASINEKVVEIERVDHWGGIHIVGDPRDTAFKPHCFKEIIDEHDEPIIKEVDFFAIFG